MKIGVRAVGWRSSDLTTLLEAPTCAADQHAGLEVVVTPAARSVTDGWLGYENPPHNPHEVIVVQGRLARTA